MRGWVVGHRYAALNPVMWTLSAVGRGGMIWVAVGAIIAWRTKRWHDFATLAIALLVTTIVADYILKPIVHRTRPFNAIAAVAVIGGRPHDASFPSGHAANSFAAALVMSVMVPRLRVLWWTLAAAIAFSRVYVGVHYPADIVGGAVIGTICSAAVVAARRRLLRGEGESVSHDSR